MNIIGTNHANGITHENCKIFNLLLLIQRKDYQNDNEIIINLISEDEGVIGVICLFYAEFFAHSVIVGGGKT